jgi:hypothetical protein
MLYAEQWEHPSAVATLSFVILLSARINSLLTLPHFMCYFHILTLTNYIPWKFNIPPMAYLCVIHITNSHADSWATNCNFEKSFKTHYLFTTVHISSRTHMKCQKFKTWKLCLFEQSAHSMACLISYLFINFTALLLVDTGSAIGRS